MAIDAIAAPRTPNTHRPITVKLSARAGSKPLSLSSARGVGELANRGRCARKRARPAGCKSLSGLCSVPETEHNCVVARRGGEQWKVNNQSVEPKGPNPFRQCVSGEPASLRRSLNESNPEQHPSASRVGILEPLALNVACKSGHWGTCCVWWTEWLEGRVRESWRPGEHRTRRPEPHGKWVMIASLPGVRARIVAMNPGISNGRSKGRAGRLDARGLCLRN
jgi:hypothetical protein